MRKDSTTKAALMLTMGRTIGFAVAFAIPMILARRFSQEDFGSYRQLFLIYGTLFGLAQVGMAESLYYFLPRDAAKGGHSFANAVLVLIGAAAACAIGLSLAAHRIALRFHNPDLEGYLPALGLFLALMIVTAVLEITLVSRKQYRTASLVYASSDILKTALFVLPVLALHSLSALLLGAVVFASIRALAVLISAWREFGETLRVDWPLLRRQVAYALPFAAAVTVEIIQMNWHQYAVASWFDQKTFALYSVGCLQIPLVDLLATSVGNVMMVRMSEDLAQDRSVVTLWHQAIERLALVFVPFFVLMLLSAREIITVLYTADYVASVPIFMVSTVAILFAIVPVDSALRVFARTRMLLGLNLFRLALIATTIGWFVSRWGLPGAVLVTIVAAGASKMVALVRIAQLMRVGIRDVLPWRAIGIATASAMLALGPTLIVRSRLPHRALVSTLVIGAVYTVVYAAILAAVWMFSRSRWGAVALARSVEGR